mgnify:CR=1 FL=1
MPNCEVHLFILPGGIVSNHNNLAQKFFHIKHFLKIKISSNQAEKHDAKVFYRFHFHKHNITL